MERLRAVAEQSGLILSLDGLAPQGGEPQLWVVRELQTTLTLCSGWLREQDQATFVNFLRPIAECRLRNAERLYTVSVHSASSASRSKRTTASRSLARRVTSAMNAGARVKRAVSAGASW